MPQLKHRKSCLFLLLKVMIIVACKPNKQMQEGLDPPSPATSVHDGGVDGARSPTFGEKSTSRRMPAWYLLDTSGERSSSPVSGSDEPPAPIKSSLPQEKLPSICVKDIEGHFERIQPLFCVPVPRPTATDIVDHQAAIRLGKALFWDIQVGGDGATACATCHFNAGVDNRTLNTVHPGLDNVFASGGVTAPGQEFHRGDIGNDDRVGSQGIVGSKFQSIDPDVKIAKDRCWPDETAPFLGHRRVTGRKTPSVIGAVYNLYNFWDGRAHPNFNGFDPFGDTANATVAQVLFSNGSLASQAVGPPNNAVEMSCSGRSFNGPNSLGAKLLGRPPLQFQLVSFSDSVLGDFSAWPEKGIKCLGRSCTYLDLVVAAFGPRWRTLAQNHFSRLWGQALQAYMATLIADQTRLDQYLTGKTRLFTISQARGLDIFKGKGRCTKCHAGAELTDASVNYSKISTREDQGNDEGFHNLGVRPTDEDYGRGSVGPNGIPLSVSQHEFDLGAFKTPGLRNVKLTAPYFHNGGKATLEAVVDFYAHNGGDAPNPELSRDLEDIRLKVIDITPLVDFLRDGLTDCRVEKQRAPFDHPSLPLPNGKDLTAVGMTGQGSCRLDPGLPPTTVNCLNQPFMCESDDALVGTSVYLDLTGALPASRADLIAFLGANQKNMQIKIAALLSSAPYQNMMQKVWIKLLLRRLPTASETTTYTRKSLRDAVIAVATSPLYSKELGSKASAILDNISLDLAGRLPSASELRLANRSRSSFAAALYDSAEGRKLRAGIYYKRFLRREASAAEIRSWLASTDENISLAGLLMSKEYRAFAVARDDI